MDLSAWHTLTWGLDGQIYDVPLFHKMFENEEWKKKKANVATLTHVVQLLMGQIESELFEMHCLERAEEANTNEKR